MELWWVAVRGVLSGLATTDKTNCKQALFPHDNYIA